MSEPNQPTPPNSEPVYQPSETEKQAHDVYVNKILEASGERLRVLLQMAVMQTGHGDHVIWLSLYGLNLALEGLHYNADAQGTPLPLEQQVDNKLRVDILAAVALERYAEKLRERAGKLAKMLEAPIAADTQIPAIDWKQRDQALVYDDAIEECERVAPTKPAAAGADEAEK